MHCERVALFNLPLGEADSSGVGHSTNSTHTTQAVSPTMRLQDNPDFLLSDLPPIVNCVKDISKRLLAVWAVTALTPLQLPSHENTVWVFLVCGKRRTVPKAVFRI